MSLSLACTPLGSKPERYPGIVVSNHSETVAGQGPPDWTAGQVQPGAPHPESAGTEFMAVSDLALQTSLFEQVCTALLGSDSAFRTTIAEPAAAAGSRSPRPRSRSGPGRTASAAAANNIGSRRARPAQARCVRLPSSAVADSHRAAAHQLRPPNTPHSESAGLEANFTRNWPKYRIQILGYFEMTRAIR